MISRSLLDNWKNFVEIIFLVSEISLCENSRFGPKSLSPKMSQNAIFGQNPHCANRKFYWIKSAKQNSFGGRFIFPCKLVDVSEGFGKSRFFNNLSPFWSD